MLLRFALRPSIVYCKQRIFFFITVKTNLHFPHHLFQTHLFPLHRRSGIQFLLPEHHTCHIKEVQLKANFCIIDATPTVSSGVGRKGDNFDPLPWWK